MLKIEIRERKKPGKKGYVVGVGDKRDLQFEVESLSEEVMSNIKYSYRFIDFVLATWVKTEIHVKEGDFYNCKIVKTKESGRGLVVFFVPISPIRETIWLEDKNKIVLENGDFSVYLAYREVVGKVVTVGDYDNDNDPLYKKSSCKLLQVEACMCSLEYKGIFFMGKSRDVGYIKSRPFLPPFLDLPPKYQKMAEEKWVGEIISPGIWVRNRNIVPDSNTKAVSFGRGRWTYFGDYAKPISVIDNILIKEKIRLISAPNFKIYDCEIWQKYIVTPFGEYSIREIVTYRSWDDDHPYPSSNSCDRLAGIYEFDKRVACQFCHSPKGKKTKLHAVWIEYDYYGHEYSKRQENQNAGDIEWNICDLCIQKGKDGKLTQDGYYDIKIQKIL